MDIEAVRKFLLALPQVEETVQWGGTLVFWLGDKAIGGKMFAVAHLEGQAKTVLSFAAGPERYHELLENDGVIPAPYLARIHWVALERWDAIPAPELKDLLRAARTLTEAKLPKKTRAALALPAAERKKLIAAGRKKAAAQGKSGAS